MKLIFTKGTGKYDTMRVVRPNRLDESIECPKQRIIPHDLMHFAVESSLRKKGFLNRVRAGESAGFAMQAEAESDSVERLVEVFQGDEWSGGTSSIAEMIDMYQVTCLARGCPPISIDEEIILTIRSRIASLNAQWQGTPAGQSLELPF
jgi:hypothetical protein